MALENLTPVTRMEAILDGADITPVTREEYFWQQAATSGYELPDVTAADDGDVLTVVNGAWDKATPVSDLPLFTDGDSGRVLGLTGSPLAPAWVGRGNLYYVNVTGVPGNAVSDKTFAEISGAIDSGFYPIVIYQNMLFPLHAYTSSLVNFVCMDATVSGTSVTQLAYMKVEITDADAVTLTLAGVAFT